MHEAVGAYLADKITEDELYEIERRAHSTYGTCAGMFTANTMAVIAETLGMALPGSATPPASSSRRIMYAIESGATLMNAMELGIRPRDVMTYEAFENAITVLMATSMGAVTLPKPL